MKTILLATASVLAIGLGAATHAGAQETTRDSISSTGIQGNDLSYKADISGGGRYTVFTSNADNLVPEDDNGLTDIFVRDRQSGLTRRVSVDSNGNEGNGASTLPAISANGKFIVFVSAASNLVSDDKNGVDDIFLHNLADGSTQRVSVGNFGQNEAENASSWPAINADGTQVAFQSWSAKLVDNDTNRASDVFVRDLIANQTMRVSIDSAGGEVTGSSFRPSISDRGHLIAFESYADRLVKEDGNGVADVFVHDRLSGATTRVSVTSSGNEGNDQSHFPAISGNGRKIAFSSRASNLTPDDNNGVEDIFVHELATGATSLVSVNTDSDLSDGSSTAPAIDVDGSHIAFLSTAWNLVDGDNNFVDDIFVRDTENNSTTRASVSSNGTQAIAPLDGMLSSGNPPAIDSTGCNVAFDSRAVNLTLDDTNSAKDVFVRSVCIEAEPQISIPVAPADVRRELDCPLGPWIRPVPGGVECPGGGIAWERELRAPLDRYATPRTRY